MFRKNKNMPKDSLNQLIKRMSMSSDFKQVMLSEDKNPIQYYYFDTLVDKVILREDVVPGIQNKQFKSLENLKTEIPMSGQVVTDDLSTIIHEVLTGSIMFRLDPSAESVLLVKATYSSNRQVQPPEVEFSVVGPKEALVESIDINLNLIRKRLPIPELKVYETTVGSLTNTRIAVMSIEGITNKENCNTVIQRINAIEIDQVIDSSYITQLIQDNANSPFPQLVDTERPDRLAAVLAEGKVVILVDGAPHGLIGPTTLVEFFSAFEDYFLNWMIASFFRVVRLFSVIFSILVTPLYVAVLTYHYELIPQDLLGILVTSRSAIPLPPILEAILLEIAIELLREAGARLPTKIGQTIGIVGGIVIGTASVEAGLTSNVLLIIVALAALSSFTTPVYQMGNTIRLLRFPFLLLAHLWGLLGIAICFCFLLIHLLRLTSLGRPYLEPIYPPRVLDLKDAFVRLPFSFQSKRPLQLQTNDPIRFHKHKSKRKHDKQNK